VGRAGL